MVSSSGRQDGLFSTHIHAANIYQRPSQEEGDILYADSAAPEAARALALLPLSGLGRRPDQARQGKARRGGAGGWVVVVKGGKSAIDGRPRRARHTRPFLLSSLLDLRPHTRGSPAHHHLGCSSRATPAIFTPRAPRQCHVSFRIPSDTARMPLFVFVL